MLRTIRRTAGVVLVVFAATGCGGRADDRATNEALVRPLMALPVAERVDVDEYGYDLGDGQTEDRFFTELEYATEPAVEPAEILTAVKSRLGDDWRMETSGRGDAVLATFQRGQARVAVTTWDGGFDITVAAEGAKLDGTRLAL